MNAAAGEPADNLLSFVDSARVQALGGPAACISRDPTAVWLNPVAAAGVDDSSLTLSGQRGFIEDMTWQLLATGSAWKGAALAAGIAYYDAGTVELTTSSGTSRQVSGQQDFLGLFGASTGVLRNLDAGFSVKVMHSELVDEYSSDVAAIDLGVITRFSQTMRAGVILSNAGGDMRYREERIPLPTAAHAGCAVDIPIRTPAGGVEAALGAFLDCGYFPEGGEFEWRGGVEYRWHDAMAVRAGASRPAYRNGWEYSGGLGIQVSRYRLDYATRLKSTESAPHIFGLTVSF